jgi:tetratricopeptide (TPR) repeat protein
LADVLEKQAKYAAAEPLYRRALAIAEKHPETNIDGHDMAWAGGCCMLAWLKKELVQCVNAQAELLRAKSLDDEALRLEERGDWDAAETQYRLALEIRETWLGLEHLDVASSLIDMARLLWESKGDLVAAAKLLRRVLAIEEKHHGPDHLDVAYVLLDLAAVLRKQGEYAAAEPLYRRLLAINEKLFGPEDPVVVHFKARLAIVFGGG